MAKGSDPFFSSVGDRVILFCEGHNNLYRHMITSDMDGQAYYHAYLKTLAFDHLSEQLPDAIDFNQEIANRVNLEFADRFGLEPCALQPIEGGIMLSYPLPRDKFIVHPDKFDDPIREDRTLLAGLNVVDDSCWRWIQNKRVNNYDGLKLPIARAKDSLLRELPESSLEDVIKRYQDFYTGNRSNNIFSRLNHFLEENEDFLPTLSKELEEKGIDSNKLVFAGYGATGVFLRAGDVIIGIRGPQLDRRDEDTIRVARQPIPQHLQPLASYSYGSIQVEITPALQPCTDKKALRDLSKSIHQTPAPDPQSFWCLTDSALRNVGLSDTGTAYVLDGDAIELLTDDNTIHNPPKEHHVPSDWLTDSGVWKQYEEFQSLHKAFNSPLNQNNGLLSGKEAPQIISLDAHAQTRATSSDAADMTDPDASRRDNEPSAEETPSPAKSNTPAILALFAGATATVTGLLGLKKKQRDPSEKDEAETKNRPFSTTGIVLTAVGAIASGWAVYHLISNSSPRNRSL